MRRSLSVLGSAAVIAASAVAGSAAHASSAASVPWSKVGPGWTVSALVSGAKSTDTLYLLDSAGHHYAVKTLPKGSYPIDWSPDGARVVLIDNNKALELTLRTGKVHTIAIKQSFDSVVYTRPKGLAVLSAVEVPVPHKDYYVSQLERFGLDGKRQQVYPRIVKGAGSLHPFAPLETNDGAYIVIGATHGLVLLRNNGTVVRRLHAVTASCDAESWWAPNVALASCGGTLWTVPINGAAQRRISAGPSKAAPFGYTAAWNYSKGRLGLATNGCGPASLVKFTAKGTGVRVKIPTPWAPKGGTPIVLGHHGGLVELLFNNGGGCEPTKVTQFQYNAVNGHSTPLLGPGATVGSVLSAVPWYTERPTTS